MGWPELFDWLRAEHPAARIETDDSGITTLHALGEPLAEYAALRDSAGLLLNPDWAIMIVEGKDAIDYLHRRLSQSISTLADGEGAHTLQLEGDGRMVGHMLLYRLGDVAFCLAERDNAEAMYKITEKFTLMDEVNVHKQWEAEAVIALAGAKADELIARLTGATTNDHPYHMIVPAQVGGHVCRVFRDGRYATPFYRISVAYGGLLPLAQVLAAECRTIGGGVIGFDASEVLRISEGVAHFGSEATNATIPLEVSLDHAISFDKGCYPGQEIIARIRNLGHPARQLVAMELSGEHSLPHGALIRVGGVDAGFITSSQSLPGLGRTLALGGVKWKDRESAQAEVVVGNSALPATMRMV